MNFVQATRKNPGSNQLGDTVVVIIIAINQSVTIWDGFDIETYYIQINT